MIWPNTQSHAAISVANCEGTDSVVGVVTKLPMNAALCVVCTCVNVCGCVGCVLLARLVSFAPITTSVVVTVVAEMEGAETEAALMVLDDSAVVVMLRVETVGVETEPAESELPTSMLVFVRNTPALLR